MLISYSHNWPAQMLIGDYIQLIAVQQVAKLNSKYFRLKERHNK